ncbi:hypothetical protein TWF191_004826 [Orbilia oligospora]|uniref:DUF6697 domain-containing protein n=1 Tax=Orbilia oligospora TaxID=2813651 RepID=A0A7C8V0M8_ORBOL|nr:hypothetical protein TWF191_004826 [Orbilia oligospora]
MARVAFLRESTSRAPILTEPLTPREWAAFGTAIGEPQDEQVPEHLRFHNPAWNLSLFRTLAQKRWEEQGGEGELEEPGPIDTSAYSESENVDMVDKMDTTVDEEGSFTGIAATNILPEGRMRKKAKLDYSGMFMPFHELDDEDDGKKKHRSPVRDISGDRTSNQLLLGSGMAPDSLPKPQHKRRGRPPRKPQLTSEFISEMDDLSQGEDTPGESVSSKGVPFLVRTVNVQTERRKALLDAGNKMPEINWLKRDPIPKSELSAIPPPSTSGLVLPSTERNNVTGYKKRVSLAPGFSQSTHRAIMNTISHPTKQTPPTEEKTTHQLTSSLPEPSPSPIRRGGSSSPTSSEYEKFFSRRDHISPLIGGNIRAVVVTTSAGKPNASIQTKGYMAIQPAWNPHAPRKAGENGSMMQLSETSTDPISKTQKNFPLFVARRPHQWEYCGQYKVVEVVKLSAFENWMHLSTGGSKLLRHWGESILQKRFEWAKNMFMQNCGWSEEKWRTAAVEDIMGPILAGTVPMHWVHLQCVGFDLEFYEALLRQKVKCGLAASQKIIL